MIIFSFSLISSNKEENTYLIFLSYSNLILSLLIKYNISSLSFKLPQIIFVFIINSDSSLNISILSFLSSIIDFNSK